MSGRKCSAFRLQQEREEKLRLLRNLENLQAEVSGLRKRLTALIEEASEGLRATFAEDVGQAQRWMRQVVLPDISKLGVDTNVARLRSIQTDLEQAVNHGRQIRERLMLTFTQKADDMGQRLAKRLTDVEKDYISRQRVLQLWCGEKQTQTWERALEEARSLHREERYTALERVLENSKQTIHEKTHWAEEQENKHQKRLYLLKALRQVCREMGFEETSSPRYERQDDRGSRILFTVDTLDRGMLAFTLSLDEVSSFSEITQDHCFEEFGQLSQYLEEKFGIHTQFRLADGEPVPDLIRKGELDLPDDTGMQAKA